MREGPDISQVGALIGDPARANILVALMDGRAMDPAGGAPVAQRARQSALDYLATSQAPRPAP